MSSTNLHEGGHGTKTKVPTNQCSVCYNKLSPSGLFCQYCDPPLEPELVPDSVLSLGKTLLQIIVIVILFAGATLLKSNITFEQFFQNKSRDQDATPLKERAAHPDFKVIHFVNVHMANVRTKPSMKGPIIMVLANGEEVTILERLDKWSQITVRGKSGWIGNGLLNSKVQ